MWQQFPQRNEKIAEKHRRSLCTKASTKIKEEQASHKSERKTNFHKSKTKTCAIFLFQEYPTLCLLAKRTERISYYEPQISNVILRIEPSTTRVGGSIIDVGCCFQRGSEHRYVSFRYYLTSTFLLLPSAIFTMFRPLTGASSLRPSIE